jgi:hypothetical protein
MIQLIKLLWKRGCLVEDVIDLAKFIRCELTHHQWKEKVFPSDMRIDCIRYCRRCSTVHAYKDGKEIAYE